MTEAIKADHESDDVPVLKIVSLEARRPREPQLTDNELKRIRAMLQGFEKLSCECPIASRILTR